METLQKLIGLCVSAVIVAVYAYLIQVGVAAYFVRKGVDHSQVKEMLSPLYLFIRGNKI